jgi:hypothetical protein
VAKPLAATAEAALQPAAPPAAAAVATAPPAAVAPPATTTSDEPAASNSAAAVVEPEPKPAAAALSVVTSEELSGADKAKALAPTPSNGSSSSAATPGGTIQRGKSVDSKPARGAASTPVASAPAAGEGVGWKRGVSMPGGAASAAKDSSAVAAGGSSLRYDKATLLSLFSRTPKIPAELSKLYPAHLQKERVPIHVERQQQPSSHGGRSGGGSRHDRGGGNNQQQSTVSDAPHPDEAIIFSPEHLSDESHFKYAARPPLTPCILHLFILGFIIYLLPCLFYQV